MARIRLRTGDIHDAASFHREFQRALGFFEGYGQNLDAWIDCMASLRQDDGLVALQLDADEVLIIEIPEATAFRLRAPEIFQEFVDCTGFANRRYLAMGQHPAITLAFE